MLSDQSRYVVAGAVGGILALVIVGVWVINSPEHVSLFLQRLRVSTPPQQSILQNSQLPPASVAQNFSSEEERVIAVVKRANPAVVSIVISKDVPIVEQFLDESPVNPFDPFFGGPFQFRVPNLREQGVERREIGGGSGFLVSPDGLIVTNRHVVSEENANYTVFTNDGNKHEAVVVARDPVNDIAIIKIQGENLPFLEFGSSDGLQVGQTAIAIGNALSEFSNTVSVGVISGLSRSVIAGDGLGQTEQLEEVIQTDAAINPGNSGGPLLDSSGRVVGVNVAVALGSENIGFALPGDLVKAVVQSVKETGKIVRPFLGVRYTMVTPAIQAANQLPVDYGALITGGDTPSELGVMPGSAADKAGLVVGDIILEIDGVRLEDDTTLASVVRNKKPGDRLRLKVLSKSVTKDIEVKLGETSQ